MAKRVPVKPLRAWEDRFRTPDVADLLHCQTKALASVIEHAVERLTSFDGAKVSVEWQGIPWRWTIVVRLDADESPAFAYVVPEPGKPQLVIPVRRELIEALPMKRLGKGLRDRITFSTEVAGVRWVRLDFATKTQFDEAFDLAQRKQASTAPA